MAIFPEIPSQLLAEATAESLTASESSSPGSGGDSSGAVTSIKPAENIKLSGEKITSNVIKTENTDSKQKTSAKESKLAGFTKIIEKAIEIIKKVVISVFIRKTL